MFAQAYKQASKFTQPVIIFTRLFDGTVNCECGAFVIVNNEGWIVTVAHLWDSYSTYEKHADELDQYDHQIQSIKKDRKMNSRQKRSRVQQLETNPEWITNSSFWWGRNGVQLKDALFFRDADMVIGRLDPFDPKSVNSYPVFKRPETIEVGTMLCKLGYPFHLIEAIYDDKTDSFNLAPGSTPLPRFPLEGIYTRNVKAGRSKEGNYDIEFLETSSPGLRGQSGGPIFDMEGTVWSIQSRTMHFPLGFNPATDGTNQETGEIQYLNVGWGIHPRLLTTLLRDNGIKFKLSKE